MTKDFLWGIAGDLSVGLVIHHVVCAIGVAYFLATGQYSVDMAIVCMVLEMGSGMYNVLDLRLVRVTRDSIAFFATLYTLSNAVCVLLHPGLGFVSSLRDAAQGMAMATLIMWRIHSGYGLFMDRDQIMMGMQKQKVALHPRKKRSRK